MTETVTLTEDETALVRTIIRLDTDHHPDDLLDSRQLTVEWETARQLMQALSLHMTKAMADAHESGEFGDLDIHHTTVESVNNKLLRAFHDQ